MYKYVNRWRHENVSILIKRINVNEWRDEKINQLISLEVDEEVKKQINS